MIPIIFRNFFFSSFLSFHCHYWWEWKKKVMKNIRNHENDNENDWKMPTVNNPTKQRVRCFGWHYNYIKWNQYDSSGHVPMLLTIEWTTGLKTMTSQYPTEDIGIDSGGQESWGSEENRSVTSSSPFTVKLYQMFRRDLVWLYQDPPHIWCFCELLT